MSPLLMRRGGLWLAIAVFLTIQSGPLTIDGVLAADASSSITDPIPNPNSGDRSGSERAESPIPPDISSLIAQISDPDTGRAKQALLQVAVGSSHPALSKALAQAARHPDGSVSRLAFAAMGRTVEQSLDQLLALLQDNNPRLRLRAAGAMISASRSKPDKAVAALQTALQDPDRAVQRQAERTLSFYRVRTAKLAPIEEDKAIACGMTVPECIAQLTTAGSFDAVEALRPVAPDCQNLAEPLTHALAYRRQHGLRVSDVVNFLQSLGSRAMPALDEIVACADKGADANTLIVVVMAVLEIAPQDPRIAPALNAAMESDQKNVKGITSSLLAAKLTTEVPDFLARPTLLALQFSEDPQSCVFLAGGIGRVANPPVGAEEILLAKAAKGPKSVTDAANWALAQIRQKGGQRSPQAAPSAARVRMPDGRMLDAWVADFPRQDRPTKLRQLSTLRQTAQAHFASHDVAVKSFGPAVVEALALAIDDADTVVAAAAIGAVSSMAPHAGPALLALRRRAEGSDPQLRQRAQQAIRLIEGRSQSGSGD